jgi:hypothetical protein
LCSILWNLNQTLSFHSTYAIHFWIVSNTNLETTWTGELCMTWAPCNIGEWQTHGIINDQLELGLWKTSIEAVGNICSMWNLGFCNTVVEVSILRCDAISHKNGDLIWRVTGKKENHFENCLCACFCLWSGNVQLANLMTKLFWSILVWKENKLRWHYSNAEKGQKVEHL